MHDDCAIFALGGFMALLDSKSCGVSHQALIGGACT
jgi:hypothetical protein